MKTDVLIIGSGPAGLSTAFETASRGLDVTIIDESILLGGQLNQQTQLIRSLPFSFPPMRGFEIVNQLIEQLEEFPIRYLLGHRVVGLYKDGTIGVTNDSDVLPVQAKKIVVATGASEKAIAFPKWTLPGIMTIGAAQTLVNRDFVLPGKDAIIAGSSDFALDVAKQLREVGVNIKGIVENSSNMAARDVEKIEQIEGKIPIYYNSTIKEARGQGRIEEIDIQQPGKVVTESVDFVCLDGGRAPILEVFYQFGCSFGFQENLGGWIPQYDKRFHTDVDNVFLAGNAAGITTQGVLLITGMIAGIGVCESLGTINHEAAERERALLWREMGIIETKLYPNSWQARLNHIENFADPLIKDQFIS